MQPGKNIIIDGCRGLHIKYYHLKKIMRTIVDNPLKLSIKYSTSCSCSNWVLGVIPERTENNVEEIIMSPFEATQFHIGMFHKGLVKPLEKSILEDEQNYRIFY